MSYTDISHHAIGFFAFWQVSFSFWILDPLPFDRVLGLRFVILLVSGFCFLLNMPSAQDPFYVVKDEIQESIDKLQSSFHQWERISSDLGERVQLTKELLAACESIEWQVDELDKAIAVAARDPSWYGIDDAELERRRRWTSTARTQVGNVKKVVGAGKEQAGTASSNGMRRELMRLPNPHETDRSNLYTAHQANDDFITSESDRQLLLIKRQDEELDELSASVERIGGVGLTIHEELKLQDKIIDDLGNEMDSTSNRLDFVQKKVAVAHEEGQRQGPVNDDLVLGGFVHHPFCVGVPHLVFEAK
ncbi:Syntaxin-61, partial [Cucurbita argyrosperma subsp. sororia]